jgi:transposase InsO family protein
MTRDAAMRDEAREAATRDFVLDLAGASRRAPWAGRQESRRQRERLVRQQAAALCDELGPAGFSAPRIARKIGLARRTLAHWCRCRRQGELDARLRGRPPKQSTFCHRHEVLEVFQEVGPHVGLPTLRATFPIVPRGELIDLQAAFRQHYRVTYRRSVEELSWTTPGRVWAMDHAQPPAPIDGCYQRVLAVRDLASGMQLAWLAVPDETAETTAAVLRMLFACHGAPLVLKSDNGSAFISQLVYELLAAWEVVPLFSPAQMPQYNGSCEAGIGALKDRTSALAARPTRVLDALGRAFEGSLLWTSDDLEAARRQANEWHRPWGHRGPTRSGVWAARSPITADERAAFAVTLARCHQRAADALGVSLAQGQGSQGSEPGQPASPAHGNRPQARDAAPRTMPPPAPHLQAANLAHGNSPQVASAAEPAHAARGTHADRGAPAHGNSQAVDAAAQEGQANKSSAVNDRGASSDPSTLKAIPRVCVHGSTQQAIIHRRAVRQALVKQGLLSITRRSIHLPIKRLRSAKIM